MSEQQKFKTRREFDLWKKSLIEEAFRSILDAQKVQKEVEEGIALAWQAKALQEAQKAPKRNLKRRR